MTSKNKIPVILKNKELHRKMKIAASLEGKTLWETIEMAEEFFLKEKYKIEVDSIIKL